jgi:hypothetical protein
MIPHPAAKYHDTAEKHPVAMKQKYEPEALNRCCRERFVGNQERNALSILSGHRFGCSKNERRYIKL